jgi:hypothetical protein
MRHLYLSRVNQSIPDEYFTEILNHILMKMESRQHTQDMLLQFMSTYLYDYNDRDIQDKSFLKEVHYCAITTHINEEIDDARKDGFPWDRVDLTRRGEEAIQAQ